MTATDAELALAARIAHVHAVASKFARTVASQIAAAAAPRRPSESDIKAGRAIVATMVLGDADQ